LTSWCERIGVDAARAWPKRRSQRKAPLIERAGSGLPASSRVVPGAPTLRRDFSERLRAGA